MKIVTWNVNSIKVRLPQVIDWLMTNQPDVVCLQETKLQDENFPLAEIAAAGYQASYAGQKTYNGVAVISKRSCGEIISSIPDLEDPQKRVLAVTYGDVRVICIYVPNGESVESEKYQYKMKWLTALNLWLQDELHKHPKLVLLGDFNIAPEECDVHDPELWRGKVLFSQPERDAFQELINLGLVDSFRLFNQPDKSYTWWDYRMMAFRRNIGMRIDHILLSNDLSKVCTSCTIDKEARRFERPSDHAPVTVELTL
ncbi:MAG: exodeoxyribonuclease III [Nitrosomonadaceae bacterium]|nr:exodeoxyribonuclease III [Nitrosospira sp.]MDW7597700.1 exodeoxyribonuclease III [Nitrosomonadaceae bacterium]MBI0409244.1 exodeoxyribonuclease III [Nitrosospira sp.]MBI0409891.1 exodeoxyribonuclease III [Nitrosospira sp.]MBI0412531.1 exodeoxyribonuclease III [Nitrosospira sp.]